MSDHDKTPGDELAADVSAAVATLNEALTCGGMKAATDAVIDARRSLCAAVESYRQSPTRKYLKIGVEISEELRRAMDKFPLWPTDPLHALAVLGEEFGELTKAILQGTYEPEKNPPNAIRKEAIQTAAMAVRLLMSLDAYRPIQAEQHSQTFMLGGRV